MEPLGPFRSAQGEPRGRRPSPRRQRSRSPRRHGTEAILDKLRQNPEMLAKVAAQLGMLGPSGDGRRAPRRG